MKRTSMVAGLAISGLIAGGASLIAIQDEKSVIGVSPPAVDSEDRKMPATIVATDAIMRPPSSTERERPPKQPVPNFAIAAAIDAPPVAAAHTAPVWRAVLEPGDTLDALLSRADLDAPLRAEIALALETEYDLRQLRPGHRLDVHWAPGGVPAKIVLAVEDGVQVQIDLDGPMSVQTAVAEAVQHDAADEVAIDGSVYASLDRAGLPARFAVDLAQVLGDTVDLRRDLQGGESLRIMWSRTVTVEGAEIGRPQMSYAALDLSGMLYEVVWSEESSGRADLFKDGEALRSAAPPVEGARLSSVFGSRRHPVFGDIRKHTGIDYAAPHGAPILATAPGRVAFIGRRGGYGKVVELSHGSDTMTRYAHLSRTSEGLSVGDRVGAGDVIGHVGATGTATGPNLHYEVRVEGQPIDSLARERFAAIETTDVADASLRLRQERTKFTAIQEVEG